MDGCSDTYYVNPLDRKTEIYYWYCSRKWWKYQNRKAVRVVIDLPITNKNTLMYSTDFQKGGDY